MPGEIPMMYLSQGRADQALLWVFNDYIGYGIVWLLVGIAIFSVTYGKSKSAAISGFVFAMFLSLINVLLPVEVQSYFALIAGVMLFMVVYRIVR
jgi:hypothetical protein